MTITATAPASGRAPATGPDILEHAAVLLPSVVDGRPVYGAAVPVALNRAASQARGVDRAGARRLAGEATDLFVAWLAGIGETRTGEQSGRALRRWSTSQRAAAIGYALRAAAEHWRYQLLAAMLPDPAPSGSGREEPTGEPVPSYVDGWKPGGAR